MPPPTECKDPCLQSGAGRVHPALAYQWTHPYNSWASPTNSRFSGSRSGLLCSVSPDSSSEWVGLDSTAGAAITEGSSGTTGTKIVFIDFAHQVIVEVSGPDAIRVRNASGGQRAGRLTLHLVNISV